MADTVGKLPGNVVKPFVENDTLAVIFLALTYALGPGLLVNVLLKGYWGRARPE